MEVHPRYERVRELFESYVRADPTYSAQLCVFRGDEVVVDLIGGPQARAESVTGVFSVSKAISALVIASLLEQRELDLDQRAAYYWPEFAQEGKDLVTVRQLLSHQAGLPAIEGATSVDDIVNSERAASRLAEQIPAWHPGSAFGYHALTIGVFMEELTRRITGGRLQDLYEAGIRAPRGIDFYLGLPREHDNRYIDIQDAIPTSEQEKEIAARPPVDALAARVFANVDVPAGNGPDGLTSNNIAIRRAGPAAIGGVGSARGLAMAFAAALGHVGTPIASRSTFRRMSQMQSWGHDRVLNVVNSFGVVFQTPQPRSPFAGVNAFGHDGAGGAFAYADPESEIAFGYIPTPMQYPGGADPRAHELARTIYAIEYRQ